MKKLFIAAFVILMLFGSTAWGAQWLKGVVTYANGDGVGPGKPVYVYFAPNNFGTVYTRAAPEDSWYKWSFYPPQYFYKVRCRFTQGGWIYEGQTYIDATLSVDARYDITVYKKYAIKDKVD